MALPTEGILFSSSFPPAEPGNQLCLPQTNGGTPAQYVTFQPQLATTALNGVVKPDGTTVTIDEDGTIHAVATLPGGGGGGGTGGGGSASGGAQVCVVPSGAKDGSNTQYVLPAPVLAGNDPLYFRNGVKQRQLGTKAEFSIQGTQLTVAPAPITQPLQPNDWHELHYVMGTPNSESGGSGGVNPSTNPLIRGSNIASSNSASSITVALPAGTQPGDLAICFAASGWPVSTPSGWTVLESDSSLPWMAGVFSKVLTSGDISAGSVTVTFGGTFDCVAAIVTFIGATGGIRESEYSTIESGINIITNVTTSAVLNTDVIIYFSTSRGDGAPAAPTITPASGSAATLQAATTTDASSLLADQTPPGGALSVDSFFPSPGSPWAAQVVVMP